MHAVESYLAVRRATGATLLNPAWHLRSFARFAQARGDRYVRAHTAIAWARQTATPAQRGRRLQVVIRLARYLRAEDARHEVPPTGVFVTARTRRVPFIYAPTDLTRLLQAAAALGLPGSLRPHTYVTLLALLAATGLRISEALALRCADLTADGLVIQQTKFKKRRLVPLHPTATAGLARYLARRRRFGGLDDHVFVSVRGQALRYNKVLAVFLGLVRGLGLHPGPGQAGPRLHDLRHTFAVRALEACPDGRERVGQHLLALSTYLGHADVADTYWYLQATPQLLGDIADAAVTFVGGGAP